ncbi:MAG: cobalamin-binding protein [Armatimonadetes bacterium]|nr:cobalamin-binding protein [Armatimonadota bacterium]MDW8122308.1 cobalamin-binding protein [Armatimonadota bacterium]
MRSCFFKLRKLPFRCLFLSFCLVFFWALAAVPVLAGPVTVRDDLDRKVQLSQPAQRVVSLSPATTEILFAIGAGHKLVGVCSACDYPSEVKKLPVVGDFMKPSLERIAHLSPELIILSSATILKTVAEELQSRTRCPVFVLRPQTVRQMIAGITKIGSLTGDDLKARRLSSELTQRLNLVRKRLKDKRRPRVVVEISPPPSLMVVGSGTYLSDAIVQAGGRNCFEDSSQPFPLISRETLYRQNPDVYIVASGSDPKEVALRENFSLFEFVQKFRIYQIDPDLLFRPGPRLIEGIEVLAKILHP